MLRKSSRQQKAALNVFVITLDDYLGADASNNRQKLHR